MNRRNIASISFVSGIVLWSLLYLTLPKHRLAADNIANKKCTLASNPCDDCDTTSGNYYCQPILDPGYAWGTCETQNPPPSAPCQENSNNCGSTYDCYSGNASPLIVCGNKTYDTCKQRAFY